MTHLPNELWEMVKEYLIMPKDHFIKAAGFKKHLEKEPIDVLVFFLRVYLQIPNVTIPKICEHKNNEPLKITKRTVHDENSITYAICSFSRDTSYTYTYRRNTVVKLINKYFNIYDRSVLDKFQTSAYMYFSKILYVTNSEGFADPTPYSWMSAYKIGDCIITYDKYNDTYDRRQIIDYHQKGLVVNIFEIDAMEPLHVIKIINDDLVMMSVRITWTDTLEPYLFNFDLLHTTYVTAQKHIYHRGDVNEIIVSQIMPII